MTLQAGTTLGPFRVVAPLGRGGMASVFKAYEAALDRYIALKILPAEFMHDRTFADRFKREAKVIASLEHPNIVPIYAFGIDEGVPWMAMRLIAGGTASNVLQKGTLDWSQAMKVLRGVALALDYAHARGIVHRDVKPQNIMLDGAGHVYLGDFGIARMVEGSTALTRTGMVTGTPEYMAPEQAQAQTVDHRADIYSLGVLAYQMLTGRVPFKADTPVAVLMKHILEPLPIPSSDEVPEPVVRALLKCLDKKPEARWPSASAFVEALAKGMQESGTEIELPSEPVPSPPTEPSRPPTLPTVPTAPPTVREAYGLTGALGHVATTGQPAGPGPTPPRWNLAVGAGLVVVGGLGLAAIVVGAVFLARVNRARDSRGQTSPPPSVVAELIAPEPEATSSPPQSPAVEAATAAADRTDSASGKQPRPESLPRSAERTSPVQSGPRAVPAPPTTAAEPTRPVGETPRDLPPAHPALPEELGLAGEADRLVEEGHALLEQQRPDGALERFREALDKYRSALKKQHRPDFFDKLVRTHKSFARARMVPIRSAEFEMGSTDRESGPDEKPAHRVSLGSFRIDRYEVTNEDYMLCVEAKVCSPPERYAWSGQPKLAVTGVSWYDAEAYCKWISQRLPTEAEWEWAASGGNTATRYAWGDRLAPGDANYGNRSEGPRPVGSYRRNEFGLFDVAGNASEWCQDWYDPNYYKGVVRGARNPSGPASGTHKVKRGGSWKQYDPDLRTKARGFMTPSARDQGIGFRCAGDL